MKKIVTVLILFSLFAGTAFAQLSFSGDVYSGIQYKRDFNDNDAVSAQHRKEGLPLFNLIGTVGKENYGAKLDTSFQVTNDGANSLSLHGIYGWVNFWDNQIRLTMGKISDGVWVSSLDADHEFVFDEITGVRVEYKTPIQGLRIGAALPTQDYDLEATAKRAIFGASYVNAMFNAVIAYDSGNNDNVLFGFNFTGIDNLTSAGIQVKANNLATWDNALVGGIVQVNEKIGYRVMKPLNVYLLAGQTIYADKDQDIALTIEPGASYRLMPNLTAFLDLGISTPNYFETITYKINPSLEYTLKGPALFYVEYELELAKYKGDSFHTFGFGIDVKAF